MPSVGTCVPVRPALRPARRFTFASWLLALLLSIGLTPGAAAQEQVLLEPGSPVAYLANASDPGLGTTWTDPAFVPAAWDSGTYGIGYDSAGSAVDLLATVVPAGTISIYTRASFNVPDVGALTSLWIGSDHDDGIVVWLNGTEVFRSTEMPASGPLDWNTSPLADGESSNAATPQYAPYHDLSAAIPLLHNGDNLLAVGVWNSSAQSSDLVLVPQLVANKTLLLVRGPYLQLGTETSVRVRWRTDSLLDSVVLYGPDPGNLTSVTTVPDAVMEHEVELTDLQPATRYYYAIGSSGQILDGPDPQRYFVTFPPTGTPAPARIWVLGDSGTGGALAVRDAYQAVTGEQHTDLWLMLGDNAYPVGSDADYQFHLFDVFPEMLGKSVLWPTIGNHDVAANTSPAGAAPYFQIFSLPAQAQAGGVPSGTEAYYSFDYANLHFVVLDSQGSNRSPGGPMLTWLQSDLAATDQEWIVAYWHHPPYSDGSHDSDTEIELIEMRQNAVPILEEHGVDLVLAGHSHSYERSFLLDQHYGDSTTFGPQHVVDGGSGRSDEPDGPYQKSFGVVPHEGTVYTVAGTSGVINPGPLQHPAMFISWEVLGSLVLEVQGNRLDLTFLDTLGGTLDYFTLVKGSYCAASDVDHDGVCDDDDNCPDGYNPNQDDADDDGAGDACDPCPDDPDDDGDGDGVCGDADNCPAAVNPTQLDGDGDGQGDACDPCPADPADDGDGDGHCGDVDNCPGTSNPSQQDADADGLGDACDACPTDPDDDLDGDGLCGDVDNCPAAPNLTQADTDGDGAGNACDACPLDADNDGDGDGYCASADNCPTQPNDQSDADADGVGDICDPCPLDGDNDFDLDGICGEQDNCPGAANVDQADADGDGFGDACDFPNDADGDSVPDGSDNCPGVSNPAQQDTDADGQGDSCDGDADGDGVPDALDCAPLLRGISALPGDVGATLLLDKQSGGTLRWQRATQGPVSHVYTALPVAGADAPSSVTCLDVPLPETVSVQIDVPLPGELFAYLVGAANACGTGILGQGTAGNTRAVVQPCPVSGNDTDGDGIHDLADSCPLAFDPSLSDVDADFVGDLCDNCPTVGNPQQLDGDTNGQGDACADLVDGDLDGIEDLLDNCPAVPNTTQIDADEDGSGDACDVCPNDDADDGDADGLCADADNCPTSPNADQVNTDGDGLGNACDPDDDNDGVADADDPQPHDPTVCGDADADACEDCVVGTDGFGPLPDSLPGGDGPDFDGDGACDAGDPDDDNDAVPDRADSEPFDPFVCRDEDADGCDDCSSGVDNLAEDGPDFDFDFICDLGDLDDDNDGVDDSTDPAPYDPSICGDADTDTCDDCVVGNDGIAPRPDNDPLNDGPDTDVDGACDAGDLDDDNDGVPDATDPAGLDPDVCGDADGDGCDDCAAGTDDLGPLPDNDPANDGADNDGDGACDAGDLDDDNDGVADVDDAEPLNAFACRDLDSDSCDDCASGADDPAGDGTDTDADGTCNAGDLDDDNDGVEDADDADPLNAFACRDLDNDSCDDCASGTDDPADDGTDTDADGTCNAGDLDDDNDGVEDADDADPLNAFACRDLDNDSCDDCSSGADDPAGDGTDTDADGACDAGDADDDNDGVEDAQDAEPLNPFACRDADADSCDDCASGSDAPASDGADNDADGACDDGDDDDDNDGVADAADPAPLNPDVCGDADADACDDCSVGTDNLGPLPDSDPANDGLDTDGDGACDLGDLDVDNDGVPDLLDEDPLNPFVCRDADGDSCDDCASGTDDPAGDGTDTDADGACDAGDSDDDNDGVADTLDNDPLNPFVCRDADGDSCDDCASGADNPADDGTDTDGDGACNAGDEDDDNDGVADTLDGDPLNPFVCRDADGDSCDDCASGADDPADDGTDTDGDGDCNAGDEDDDNDGVADTLDSDPLNPFVCRDVDGDSCDDCASGADDPADDGTDTDGDGDCNAGDGDDDNDGVDDGADPAPHDPDVCGDSDGDSCDDCVIGVDDVGPLPDAVPGNDGVDFDADGLCDGGDADDDNDGVADTLDGDPLNPFVCRDADADGCEDCSSGTDAPADDGPDHDGDGACDPGDADDDNDGVDDTLDSDPLDPFVCRDADGDSCDDCASGTDDPAGDGTDTDVDGACDAGDSDDDNDGVADTLDNDPLNPFVCRDADGDSCDDCASGADNPADDGTDTDGDGACNAGDEDDDNDGVADTLDGDPLNPFVCRDADGDSCDDCASGADDPADDGTDTDGDGDCNAGDEDDDNDGVADTLDSDPLNPFVCRDADGDSCDDCASGADDPADDGTDTDGDGDCNAGDGDDDNDGVDDGADPAPHDPDVCGDSDGDSCDDCVIGVDDLGPLPDAVPGNDGVDFDADGLCDGGDADDDNDGVGDADDQDPFDPFVCRDADHDSCDDCMSGADDPGQDGPDNEGDGLCDSGDSDDDNDAVPDTTDNCPVDFNPLQANEDQDRYGDDCDPCLADPFNDADGDQLCTSSDNCPSVFNPLQGDVDANGIGDVCEIVTVAGQFRIRATEVTNQQYAAFLNAVADADPNGLYNLNMTTNIRGGILRFGFPGSFSYLTKQNMHDKPVNFVSWLDAARFANWLHHGQPNGPQGPNTTEQGAYDLTVPDPGLNATRSLGASWFLPTKGEWDVAAYADLENGTQWLFPTRSSVVPTKALATPSGGVVNAGLNVANYDDGADWNLQNGNVTTVAACGRLSASYWGTYDQGGNIAEWTETLGSGDKRRIRGGSFKDEKLELQSTANTSLSFSVERVDLGFRVAGGL